jgi:hypothetical protein
MAGISFFFKKGKHQLTSLKYYPALLHIVILVLIALICAFKLLLLFGIFMIASDDSI